MFMGNVTSAVEVRLKDISKIVELRDNQLYGFGLVIGLQNSGDSKNTLFTNKALTNLLKKMGLPQDKDTYISRNIASVMVTAILPPFVKKGQKIGVVVSSIGDAQSLAGGTLLMTPLTGVDQKTYALAQGPLIVGGLAESSTYSRMIKNQATVGRIPEGAIVEEEVAMTLSDENNITIVLNEPNFSTAAKAEIALLKAGFVNAKAIDANTIKVPLTKKNGLVETVAKLENIYLTPDASNKVIINSKTGTVIIGEMVRLSPVAISQGNISIKILDEKEYNDYIGYYDPERERNPITIKEEKSRLVYLKPDSTLGSLVKALNQIGTTPKDLISIIQALKASGALIAEVEII
jgi:flagellar P-ring protein precursor FlgI